jgi:hypothetical protein
VFSNGVQASHIGGLQKWLDKNGFVANETEGTVSAKLLHHGMSASYCLSFIKARWVLPAGCDMH